MSVTDAFRAPARSLTRTLRRAAVSALAISVLAGAAVAVPALPASHAVDSLPGISALAELAAIPTADAAALSPASRVVSIARGALGKPYVFGAAGPRAFDCSGLVLYVFRKAGLASRVGGGHNVRAIYRWFAARGLVSQSDPEPGDLVVYGGGAHIGIYIGGGRIVNALNPSKGVVIRTVHGLHLPFTAYLHTHLRSALSGKASAPKASSTPPASPAPKVKSPAPKAATPKAAIPKAASQKATRAKATASKAKARYVAVPIRRGSTRVAKADTRLRARPAAKSRVIGLVLSGSPMTVYRAVRSGGVTWYRVRADGRLGWIAAKMTRPATAHAVRPARS